MSQSLTQLLVHIIFHVKNPLICDIRPQDSHILYAYIGGIIKKNDCKPI